MRRYDSAGVAIVENQGPSTQALSVRLEFVRQYGSLESDDSNLHFQRPADVGIDAAGRVHVFDVGNHRIQVFGRTGRFERSIGRKGRGPGELDAPQYFGVMPDGQVTLVSQNIAQLLGSDGKETARYFFDRPVQTPGGRVLAGGRWIVDAPNGVQGGHPLYDPAEERRRPLTRVIERSGKELTAFGMPDFRTYEGLEVAFRSVFVALAPDSGLYVSHGYRNAIERYARNGKLLMRVQRPPLYEQVVKFTRKGGHLDYDVSALSQGLDVDAQGRLWSQAFHRRVNSGLYSSRVDWTQPMFTLELFDPTGTLLGYIKPTVTFSSFRIFGDRLFLIDQYADMLVREYRIVG